MLSQSHRLSSPLAAIDSTLWDPSRALASVCVPSPRSPPTFHSGAACGLGGFALCAPQTLPSRERALKNEHFESLHRKDLDVAEGPFCNVHQICAAIAHLAFDLHRRRRRRKLKCVIVLSRVP